MPARLIPYPPDVDPFAVGSPDWTYPEHSLGMSYCGAGASGWVCTRASGHAGRHTAGQRRGEVTHVWAASPVSLVRDDAERRYWAPCYTCWYVDCNAMGVCAECGACTDDSLCGACYDDAYTDDPYTRWVESYSYQPSPVFHTETADGRPATLSAQTVRTATRRGEHPVYLGLELEFDTDDANADARSLTLAGRVVRGGEGLIYCKSDSSVNGVEMVTHPMSYEFALRHFPWQAMEDLRQRHNGQAGDNGIHVHISRAAFTDEAHTLRFLVLLYRNRDMVRCVARRDSQRWAPFSDANELVRKSQGASGSRGRYVAVNTSNEATLEVRVFRSSLHRTEIMAALGLVHAACEYTRTMRPVAALGSALTWPKFVTWLRRRPRYYALASEITRLCPPDKLPPAARPPVNR